MNYDFSNNQPDEVTVNDDDTVTIAFPEDVERGKELYHRNAVFRKFIRDELVNKAKYLYDIDSHPVTSYEVTGFLYRHAGEKYTVDILP